MSGVFINYRSADGRVAAEAIYRDLAANFGAENVFLDKQAIMPGVPYPTKIRTWIHERCSVMIAVIGPDWLSVDDGAGTKLLFRPGDWVHDEIADALALGLPVLPVPIYDTPLPDVADLPKAIKGLITREEVRIRSFDEYREVQNLVHCIEALDPDLGMSQGRGALSDLPVWAQRTSDFIYQSTAQVYKTVYGAGLSAALLRLTQSLGGSTSGAASVLSYMSDRRAAAILEDMPAGRVISIWREIDPRKKRGIMDHLPAEIRYQIEKADYTENR